MNVKCFATGLAVAAMLFSSTPFASAEETDSIRLPTVVSPNGPLGAKVIIEPAPERPAVLPALYISLGAMQALDVYTTRMALKAGASEANAVAAPFAGNTGSMLGLKVASTAGTIFFAERMWQKNKAGAIFMMAAINGVTAAVSMHNMRNARAAAAR